MARFCRYCGSPIQEGVRFCPECGKKLVTDDAPQQTPLRTQAQPVRPAIEEVRPAAQPASPAIKEIEEIEPAAQQAKVSAKEKTKAEKPKKLTAWEQKAAAKEAAKEAEKKAAEAAKAAKAAKTAKQAAEKAPAAAKAAKPEKPSASRRSQPAAATQLKAIGGAVPGELDCGELAEFSAPGAASGAAAETAAKVLSPVAGIFRGIGSWIGGIFSIFKKPAALIGVVLFAVLWVVLGSMRGSDSGIVNILSWLTFAEGGAGRELPGAVLGALGKGTVAAAIISFFTGGFVNVFKGLGVLITGRGEKRGIVGILIGLVIGAVIYFAFAGADASAETSMAGIAGALLSIEALGGSSGKLYELASSLTSKKINGIRTEMRGKAYGVLTGLTLGFAVMAVLSVTGVLEGML